MSKKILMIWILCLIAGSNLMAANLLLNPGFEADGTFGQINSGAVIANWVQWGAKNGWYHNDAGKVRDLKAVKIWMADTAIYQDFTVSAGGIYDIGVYALSSYSDNTGLAGQNAVCVIQWLDSTKAVEKGIQTIGTYYGGGVDPYDAWKHITGMCAAPAGATYGRVWLKIVVTTGTIKGSINWDDVSVEQNLYMASNPNPANNSTADYGTPITLSWTRPAPRHSGDTISCDVWFGTDPNMPGSNTKIVSNQAVSSKLIGALASSTDYYWRVDCYDPNSPGSTIKTNGMVWTFSTRNQPPTVDAGKKQSVWLSSGTVTAAMNATVTDDGFPHPTNLTYTWTKDSGPGTPAFSPSNTVKNPNVTFTVAGDYILRLTANDGQYATSDTVLIRVYAQSYTGLVGYWKLDETSDTIAYDSSGYGHDGTIYGNPVWTAGQKNGALSFDGTGDFVNCGAGAWADLTSEITVSAWVKCTFNKSWQAIVTKGDSSWRLFRNSDPADSENTSFTLNGNGFTPAISGSTGPVGDDKWHQVVGTYDGSTQSIYVDGILAASNAVPEGSVIDLNYWNVCIGADDEHEGQREFKGLIDEVRIYEIGLNASQVLTQFIADGGHDSCGLNYLSGDLNKDCYINLTDFALLAKEWLNCSDVTNSICH